MPTLAVFQQYC